MFAATLSLEVRVSEIDRKCEFLHKRVFDFVRSRLKAEYPSVVVSNMGSAVIVGFPKVTHEECPTVANAVISLKDELAPLYEKYGYKLGKVKRSDHRCSRDRKPGCVWRIEML